MIKRIGVILLLSLAACAPAPKITDLESYDVASRKHLYELKQWLFEGRMSITGAEDSWSASIEWQHEQGADKINLSGPLGQGAVVIKLTEGQVSVDDGSGKIEQSDEPDLFVMQKLGVFVPVRALAYWVVGLPDPERRINDYPQGFEQEGWRVGYKEWQSVEKQVMPHKINVHNDRVKLKLVFDRWKVLND